ncbi:Peptidyl-prolyl cis-trans isomerase fpr2 [Basidiobolus ranarum]|uniref:peptidylprolyl isomerase n=1 Tax=Basidiobolus ranarum TaxID=34480 RepID=A0ABR2WT61_9FUNG
MTRVLYFLAAACLLIIGAEAMKEAPKQLQIGIKKRATDCVRRSKDGDSLSMHYTGKLFADGTEFDSSIPRGEPFDFTLGAGHVIKGWDQGLKNMCVGEKRKLVIPSELGYGSRGAPPKIPADATLVFDVELLAINSGKDEL